MGEHAAEKHPGETDTHAREQEAPPPTAREEFGGVNWGAAFFGWLVAIAIAVLLSSIVGAIASGIGNATDLTQTQAERDAGTIGIAAAITIVVILTIAYYTGGYVAGRMSRFDSGRTGAGVWVIGLVTTLVAVAVGVVFGDQYNVFDRVDLPRIPVPKQDATVGGIVTAVVLVFGTLLAAVIGGKVGLRYHAKVDRAVRRPAIPGQRSGRDAPVRDVDDEVREHERPQVEGRDGQPSHGLRR